MDRKRPFSTVTPSESTSSRGEGDRKRRISENPSSSSSSHNNGKGPANGHASMPGEEEEGELDSLSATVETFRKEAIYRQMLEYKRMHSRSSARVAELERRKQALEAGLEGVEVCWSELLEAVRGLVGTKGLPLVDDAASTFPTSPSGVPDLTNAINRRSQSTQQLLIKFLELSEKGARASSDELRERSAAEHKKSATLKSSVKMLQSQLNLARQEQEQTLADLVKAEKKVDRMRCQSVQNVEQNAAAAAAPPPPEPPKPEPKDEKPTPKEEEPVQVPVETFNPEDRALADSRLEELNRMKEQRVRLETNNEQLRFQVEHPPDKVITETGLFKHLLTRVGYFKAEAKEAKDHFEKLANEADVLRDGRQEFESLATTEARQEVELLRVQLQKKESDLARLRGQRDDLMAELSEKKAGEAERGRSQEELKALASSREERIATLNLEISRLKSKLAANAGSEGLLEFLLSEENGEKAEVSYVKSLEAKLQSAEAKINTLADQIAHVSADSTIASTVASEAESRRSLADAQLRLAKYEKILGDAAGGDSAEEGGEVQRMAKRLEEKEEELRVAELKLKENEMGTDALYAEVERLSKAWEDVSAQASRKVFNLKEMEDKLSRLATEKAKADNKYFAAMRTKEAVEAERKAAIRNVDKQLKVLEKLTESELNLTNQVGLHEKEVTVLRASVRRHQERVAELEREVAEGLVWVTNEREKTSDLMKSLQARINLNEQDRASHRATQEDLDRTRLEAGKLTAKAKIVAGGGGTSKELELQEDRDKLYAILRCSTCALRLRSHCITRCMHTFCKDCIDARLQTRQRKCPACNIGFAVSDVQQVYFQ